MREGGIVANAVSVIINHVMISNLNANHNKLQKNFGIILGPVSEFVVYPLWSCVIFPQYRQTSFRVVDILGLARY